jgi:hypothetical protein
LLIAIAGLAVDKAHAVIILTPGVVQLNPGATQNPVPNATLPTSAFTVAAESENFSTSVYSGSLFSEAINVGTLASPQYDFLYQITDNAGSTDSIANLTLSSFSTFSTYVGYSTTNIAPSAAGSVIPTDATSDLTGSNIGWDFDPGNPATTLAPGTTTYTLIIETNSVGYTNGNAAITDDQPADAYAVVPAFGFSSPPVPEPASVGLLLMTGGLLMSRRRSRGK